MNIVHIAKSRYPLTRSAPNQHAAWELIVNIEGAGVTRIGDTEYPFAPGTITVIPPGTPHAKYALSGQFVDIYALFTGYMGAVNSLYLSDAEDKRVTSLMKLMHDLYYEGGDQNRRVCERLLDAVFLIIEQKSGQADEDVLASQLRRRIISDFSDPEFQLERVMDQIPRNRDYLRRRFKETYGVTPKEYVNALRLKNAENLLQAQKQSGMSVAEIAYLSGFYDPLYFSRFLKKKTGRAPSEWKNR